MDELRFIILSKLFMESFFYEEPYIVISICEPGEEPPNLKTDSNRKDVLRVEIHDIDDVKFAEEYGYKTLDENQAKSVLEFAEKWKDKLNILVIHCSAGVCRSAGMAAALSRVYNGHSRGIIDNPRYKPSTHIQATIVKVAERMKLGYYKD